MIYGAEPSKRAARPKARKARAPADYRLQGIAVALGELSAAHYERDLAEMVLKSLDLTVDDLRSAGADDYDLSRLTDEVQ